MTEKEEEPRVEEKENVEFANVGKGGLFIINPN